ncbi:MAG: hypothetical protein ABIC82_03270 [bacterium]
MFKVFITSSAKKSAKKLPREVKEEVVKLCENYIASCPFDAEKRLIRNLTNARQCKISVNVNN